MLPAYQLSHLRTREQCRMSAILQNGSCYHDHIGVQHCICRAYRMLLGCWGVRVTIRCSSISHPCVEDTVHCTMLHYILQNDAVLLMLTRMLVAP